MGGIADAVPPVCGPEAIEAAGVATDRGSVATVGACARQTSAMAADICQRADVAQRVPHGPLPRSAGPPVITAARRPLKVRATGFSVGPPHETGAETTISPQDSRNRGTACHAPGGARPRATHHTPGIRRV